jgi:RNA polymerase sigma-70 factor (ECF subfamily)
MGEIADIENYIAKCALGDRDAFSSLYAATSAKLFGVCLRVLGNSTEAEDALQDVFVKIWRNADRYQVNGLSPMTWLITIARNLSIDRLRSRKTVQGAGLDAINGLASPDPTPEALAIAASEQGQIAACMAELDADRSDAVRRAYLEGETYQELAARYDVPLNTIRTWLRRSLIKLKECLSR